MMNNQTATIWDRLESRWPASINGKHVSFKTLRQKMQDFLTNRSVDVREFSHFGMVVSEMDESLAAVSKLAGGALQEIKQKFVAAYEVHVARTELEGTELEIIAPTGESFFAEFLEKYGQGLHHLSFRVVDIDGCLKRLHDSGEVELIDKEAQSGSHGKIAFAKPQPFEPSCLELCQPKDGP